MTAPSIFISYSHKDEEWKDRVVTHLRVLEMEDMLDVWDDRRIEAGDDWFPEIENGNQCCEHCHLSHLGKFSHFQIHS